MTARSLSSCPASRNFKPVSSSTTSWTRRRKKEPTTFTASTERISSGRHPRSIAPQEDAAVADPQRRKWQRNVHLVSEGETEFLRRNRIVQDENRPGSGDHKRNGL